MNLMGPSEREPRFLTLSDVAEILATSTAQDGHVRVERPFARRTDSDHAPNGSVAGDRESSVWMPEPLSPTARSAALESRGIPHE